MALERIHLRKLLKILFLSANARRSAIRADIREVNAKEDGFEAPGGDFYGPFWSDAKGHALAHADLHQMVVMRISANRRRSRLYPLLRDGFLVWWNERRRWTNTPFGPGRPLRAYFNFPGVDAIVKVDNILSVKDGLGDEHFVYPYFAPEPILSEDAARLGLWLLIKALPAVPATEIRILDVIRGRTFSIDRTPLRGNEEGEFRRRYMELLRERDLLRKEYDPD